MSAEIKKEIELEIAHGLSLNVVLEALVTSNTRE